MGERERERGEEREREGRGEQESERGGDDEMTSSPFALQYIDIDQYLNRSYINTTGPSIPT